ncbi:MAG: PorP/SprF family type IX secretion system membrane protein [Crocinitomicaceae bacterium]
MKLKLFSIISILFWGQQLSYAQQEPLFQHNYLNQFIYNPAYAGSNNLTEVGAFRNQRWASFSGGNVSNLINIHSRINESNSSVGVQLGTNNLGLSARTKAHFAYAYRIRLSEDFFVQPGFSVGIIDQRINYSAIIADFADPILSQSFAPNSTAFDANFGFLIKYKAFKLGFSIPQLLGNKLALTNTLENTYNMERQYVSHIGYTAYVNSTKNFFIQPDILLIHSPGLPFHYSLSVLTGLKKIGWIGAAYKSNYAVGANIGVSLFDQLKVGFAYDIPFGQMANITNSNNIEIGLQYQFGQMKDNKPSKSEKTVLENRLIEVVRQQEKKDSIYRLTVDSLNTELNIKQLENKVLADENTLIKDQSITTIPDQDNSTENSSINSGKNIKVEQVQNSDQNATTNTNQVNSNSANDSQLPPKMSIENIQTQSIKIKDDYFTEVLNDKEAPDGYYVVTGMYDSKETADKLLSVAKTKFDSPKILVNKRNNKYYVVLYYSADINGVIEALIESNTMETQGFSSAWALNYFKNK